MRKRELSRNIRMILQYDGTAYAGWQIQKKDRTIQSMVEHAILVVTGEASRVTGAGRTDAGVHALCQVAAFQTRTSLQPKVLFRALNANLPQDIRIIRVRECRPDFHPRFDAKNKTYSYFITGAGPYAVFLNRYSWQIPYELDIFSMRRAGKLLLGKRDFACFRAAGCSSKHSVRTIEKITLSKTDSFGFMGFQFTTPLIKISVRADAFLRHMVRNIVGTMAEIGRGKVPSEDIETILESKDRKCSGPTAPSRGLFLERIVY